MNRTLAFALAAGLASSTLAIAQAPKTAAAEVKPEAVNAKVAIMAFEQAVVATNEGQKALAAIQAKYEPKKKAIQTEASEVDSLKKQVQALPANTPDDERSQRLRTIDEKEKQLNTDAENAQNAYQGDLQGAYSKVAQKVGQAAVKYAQEHGFTLLLNYPDPRQQSPNQILWFAQETDITQAVVSAYNASSGVAAPAPSAPTPHRTPAPAHK